MESVSRIELRDCSLTNLPESLGNLIKITYISIENVPLESIPNSVGQLTELWNLTITQGKLRTVPSSIGNLKKLKEVNLSKNQIDSIPPEFGELTNLKKLDLSNNNLTMLPSEICNLSNLEMIDLTENHLEELPENFGNLKSLNILTVNKNDLNILPESIGLCERLEYMNLKENNISALPKSLGSSNVKFLSLKENKLKNLPYVLWPLKTLETLELDDNPLSEFEHSLIDRDIDTLRDYFHQRSSMAIFVSHAVIDYEPYRLADLGEYLAAKPEIYKVFLCEQDLSGNIDDFMDKNVPISDIVFFLGSKKSVFNSPDCAHELELSKNHTISVFPMKGGDVSWEDMNSIGLYDDPGIIFNPDNFQEMCEQLYENVKKFDQDHSDLYKIKTTELQEEFAPTAMKKSAQVLEWENFYQILEKTVESEDLRIFHKQHTNSLANIVKQLKDGSVNDGDFMVQVLQLYVQWSQTREFLK
ncbi:MAG: leucine-rich repeat domain-containing protein [Promethearchaeota archaeon]|nr:MAG: leucine-rich repeat domain-containing protein [Candidatus Lokiarchaeota archaeon]